MLYLQQGMTEKKGWKVESWGKNMQWQVLFSKKKGEKVHFRKALFSL